VRKHWRTQSARYDKITNGTFSRNPWLIAAKASQREVKAAVGPWSFSMSEDRVSQSLCVRKPFQNQSGGLEKQENEE